MHVFIEIPSGSQPISHLLLQENFPDFFWKFLPNVTGISGKFTTLSRTPFALQETY